MGKGKFEAQRSAKPVAEKAAAALTPHRKRAMLLGALGALALVAVIGLVLLVLPGGDVPAPTEATETSPVLHGSSKEEILQEFRQRNALLQGEDLRLTLVATGVEEEPITLVVTPAQSRVSVDLVKLEADLDGGLGRVARNSYAVDPVDYVRCDTDALWFLANEVYMEYVRPFAESSAELEDPKVEDTEEPDENALFQLAPPRDLVLNKGMPEREFTAEQLVDVIREAYLYGNLTPTLEYQIHQPKQINLERLWNKYCISPVNAWFDEENVKLIPAIPGYGFSLIAGLEKLAETPYGEELRLTLDRLEPEITDEKLTEELFPDILAEAHTTHSWVDDRTHNLELSCAALNGTILMPDEVFSFNEIVGERTREKGYREATAYIGGTEVPELGGGVCQVASTIYYAVLQADLETVQRREHMFSVAYVPMGMDAAIYWGDLDYKFKNTSGNPMKIEASVSDGKVHIVLRGIEWKDYRIEMFYEVVATEEPEIVYQDVTGGYQDGEVITTAHKGYTVKTYKIKFSRETGERVGSDFVAYSTYRKRDKVIARLITKPTEP